MVLAEAWLHSLPAAGSLPGISGVAHWDPSPLVNDSGGIRDLRILFLWQNQTDPTDSPAFGLLQSLVSKLKHRNAIVIVIRNKESHLSMLG